MKNNDYDFISSKFNEENISSPDSLTFDAIMEKGNNSTLRIVKQRSKRKVLKAALSLVACLAVFVGSITVANTYMNIKYFKGDDLISFNSYAQINALVAKISDHNISFMFQNEMKYADDSDTIVEESASFSETNTQVASVDEADVVKTDGKYIYYLNDFQIDIYSANGKDAKKVGEIKSYYASYDEMYLYGNKLVAICGNDCKNYDSKSEFCSTVQIFDITDRTNPVLDSEFTQSGSYTSSRMIGKYLYIVSSYYTEKGNYPFVIDGDNDAIKMHYDDIYSFPNPKDSGYVVMSAIDVETKDSKKKSKAILGCNSDVYCSESNMYLTNSIYEWRNDDDNCTTKIIKAELDGVDFKFTASGTVNGTIDNQYSLDEKDGYLRVSTTDFNSNYLYILDENLKQIGAVENFAQGETIRAVRYVGDYAYVITFEETDPLFIIDVSNPKNPQITGSVKISGFSDNLLPVDDNTVLGVGYGEDLDGVKLALFDVTDKNNPVVLDSKEYPYTSPAQNNIKALLINKDAGYYAFAYDVQQVYDGETDSLINPDGYDNHGGVLTFEIKDGKLVETNDFASKKAIYLQRCVYVGDYIYVLNVNDEMQIYDMSK